MSKHFLDEIITNPKYSQVAKHLSNLYKDRPEHPLDTAAFWIEYVIRHNGAEHMKSPAIHLNIFQYYMLDVVAFLLALFVIGAKLTKLAWKLLLKTICALFVSKRKTN